MVVFLNRKAFEKYSLDTIVSYYKNNDIRFYLILFGNDPINSKLQYLVNETGGAVIPFSSYEGVSKVYDLILEQKRALICWNIIIQALKNLINILIYLLKQI